MRILGVGMGVHSCLMDGQIDGEDRSSISW